MHVQENSSITIANTMYYTKGTKKKVHYVNPFILEFLKWTFPSVNLDTSIVANRGLS